ncbi:MAG: antibiotic biosynthesis monooxygenase [Verrucomicrobia bacterium]|nr:antibiotic biosynthesis monooxygenase [Verrucomicrobiota bacterium]
MVTEIIRYTVTDGRETEFETACTQAAEPLSRSSHCLGFSLQRATGATERNRYLFSVYWDSPDGHLIGFRQSQDFAEFNECLAPFAHGVEEDQHYRKTGVELTKQQFVRFSGQPR